MKATPVEQLEPGDVIDVGRHTGHQVVAEINTYDDGDIIVTYFKRGLDSYENRARDKSGRNTQNILGYRSLKPLRAGDVVMAAKGTPEAAVELRALLEDEETERFEEAANRQRNAARRRERHG